MNNINELFFDLIRVAIGTQETLSLQPSAQEWKQLYKMAKKQSLVGICFAGVQKIVSRSPLKDEEDVETKTIKTPSSTAGSANPTLDESLVPSENKLSSATANSSNGTSSDAAIANGDKQEIINFEKEVSCPLKDEIRNTKDEDVVETSNNVFCGAATGLLPDAVVNPSKGYDVDGGLTMGACSQSQTDIHSTQSDSENNSRRGFSEGAVFVNNTDQDFSGFCQNINEEAPIPEMLYLRWMGMAAKIQQRNEVVNQQCVELQKLLVEDGLRSCILKGQGVATLYKVSEVSKVPESSINHKPSTINLSALRQSGDIDVWVDAPREKIVEWARAHGGKKLTGDLHVDCKVFPDTAVELHFTPSTASSPIINKRLQKWFEEQKVKLNGLETKTLKNSTNLCKAKTSSANASESPCESKLSQIDSATSSLPTPGGSQPLVDDKHEIINSSTTNGATGSSSFDNGEINKTVFCGKATGLLPDAVVNPNMGCDVDGGLTMGTCSLSQTDIHSTQSDSEDNSRRGFSEGAVFVNNTDQSFYGFCQNINEEAFIEFNVVYLLHHIFRHYLYEGIGLRQIMDYYMTLRAVQEGQCSKAAVQEVKRTIKELGMQKFAGALMWVIANVFEDTNPKLNLDPSEAIEPAKPLNCTLGIEPDEVRGRMLLEMIMEGGNFGRSGEYAITGGEHSAWWHIKRYVGRNSKLLRYYPSEIIWHLIMKLKI